MAWLPLLLIETAGQSRQTAAAVESFRNAVLQAAPAQPGTSPPGPLPLDVPPI